MCPSGNELLWGLNTYFIVGLRGFPLSHAHGRGFIVPGRLGGDSYLPSNHVSISNDGNWTYVWRDYRAASKSSGVSWRRHRRSGVVGPFKGAASTGHQNFWFYKMSPKSRCLKCELSYFRREALFKGTRRP